MSIKSTRDITREAAIARIVLIDQLAMDKDYRALEAETNDGLEEFIAEHEPMPPMCRWTDRMIEDVLDRPFYRHSRFDNYRVIS